MGKYFNKHVAYIYIDGSWFKKSDIITTHNGCSLKIIDTPEVTRWKLFKQFISFGLYKIPKSYKCKPIKN